MYIILAAALIAIAAYYPIKLIKFYCMESFEQGLKAKITRDLREGRVSPNLILLTIGAGGLRLTRNQLDVIFEWMVQNTNEWRVHTYVKRKDSSGVRAFSIPPGRMGQLRGLQTRYAPNVRRLRNKGFSRVPYHHGRI